MDIIIKTGVESKNFDIFFFHNGRFIVFNEETALDLLVERDMLF